MIKLHALANTELSQYCLNILEKHGIKFVHEFVTESSEKLMKILNINFEQLKKIEKELRLLYGPKAKTLSDRYNDERRKRKIYGSQISVLDDMLMPNDVLNNLSFWEICGPTSVGKTQLVLTLMLNFIIQQVSPALFIDTKLDFSAKRIKNMLKARKIESDLHAGIMTYIKVERVLSAQGVVEMLEHFLEQLVQENEDTISIKMIVIDSLPAVWFLLKAESNRLSGKWLLSRLSQVINRLVFEHYIAVICVNLSLIPSQDETVSLLPQNDNDDVPDASDVSDLIEADDRVTLDSKTSIHSKHLPVLGNFWLTKPHLRLSLEFPETGDENYRRDSCLRVIKVLKSRFSSRTCHCSVRIQAEGVVDAGTDDL